MRKFEIIIWSPLFDGELFATIEAKSRGHADTLAYRMLNNDNTVIDIADVGKVDEP